MGTIYKGIWGLHMGLTYGLHIQGTYGPHTGAIYKDIWGANIWAPYTRVIWGLHMGLTYGPIYKEHISCTHKGHTGIIRSAAGG